MSSWIKAGLIGGLVVAVLNLLGIIPVVGLFTCCLGFLVYIGVGALAAHWMPLPRQAGPAAGQGAMAAALAALIGGIAQTVILLIQMVVAGSVDVMSQIPPDMLQQLEDAGLDPSIFEATAGPLGAILGGGMCCLFSLVVGALLGALGGAIWAAMRPNN